jgi:hypothetical protein
VRGVIVGEGPDSLDRAPGGYRPVSPQLPGKVLAGRRP